MGISLSQKGLYWCCSSTGESSPRTTTLVQRLAVIAALVFSRFIKSQKEKTCEYQVSSSLHFSNQINHTNSTMSNGILLVKAEGESSPRTTTQVRRLAVIAALVFSIVANRDVIANASVLSRFMRKVGHKMKVISCHSREAPVLAARYIVGVAGPPGAGKSTVASEVVRRLNMRRPG
ncbi:hypothetical protein QJS04_geneDACA023397 [Acorus gramineus]|uniref:Uncharacterized protein n=1 Tax=Acorus gramineus TaxID=55184 RepID=A0AAV9AJ80_ACOGR|nr:hypothetical protein QJS04_geneDACA023397 [Acorus gramineus]